jgi:hypothetical protein
MSKTLAVYDPAMCCSTGVCGPDLDTQLVQFSSDLEWLSAQGVSVARFNLAQEPGRFASEPIVKDALQHGGESALPLLLVDGRTVMSGAYPTRDQLAGWMGVKASSGCCGPSEPVVAESTDCCPPEEAAPAASSGCGPAETAPAESKSSCC